MPHKGVALLLCYDKHRKAPTPSFDLGNPVSLSSPRPDERWHISAHCGL
jgi:hypothetical protein